MDLFHRIPPYLDSVSGTTVLVRLLDGLGFRFRWSTEGLCLPTLIASFQFRMCGMEPQLD